LPSWGRGLVLRRWILTFALTLLNFAGWNLHAQRADFDDLLRQLPPLQRHVNGPVNGLTQQGSGELYQEFANEKFGGRWFAALLPHSNPPSYSILQRFQSWNRFIDFLQTHDAIIDVWAYGDAANGALRRMPASELAALQKTR